MADILEEVHQSFLDYSYEVNANRAFPDAHDGLKPGQRCILWEMFVKGYSSSKPHVKSAKISGGVSASWHPHGLSAIYETAVHMAQDFTNNTPLIDFHGSGGNIILGGNTFAADRYTEMRLSRLVEEGMLWGIDRNAVDMRLNFSEDLELPVTLPSLFPEILVNPTQGIGVGQACFWAGHNFPETVDMLVSFMKTGVPDFDGYYPDFPTGGTIVNEDELPQVNRTGKGRIILEATYSIEGNRIEFTEFPYQVYIEPLLDEIKDAIEKGKVHNVRSVENRSDKNRVSLLVTCTNPALCESVLSELMQHTDLRIQLNICQIAVVSKTPRLMNLEDVCRTWMEHNLSCIERVSAHDLEKVRERVIVLSGLLKALDDIDTVIETIRASESSSEALEAIIRLGYIEPQAKAILAMRLSRLSHLERGELESELESLRKDEFRLEKLVGSETARKKELEKRLKALGKAYGSPRKCRVEQRSLVKERAPKPKTPSRLVTIEVTDTGYVRARPFQESSDPRIVTASSDGFVELFCSDGKCYRVKVEDVPMCRSGDKGVPLGTLMDIGFNDRVLWAWSDRSHDPVKVIVAKNGRIKKMDLSTFSGTVRNSRGMDYFKGEKVLSILDDDGYILLVGSDHALQADISDMKVSGRASSGRIGIKEDVEWVMVCDSPQNAYPVQGLGGRGVEKVS